MCVEGERIVLTKRLGLVSGWWWMLAVALLARPVLANDGPTSLEEQVELVISSFRAQELAAFEAMEQAATPEEGRAVFRRKAPDRVAYFDKLFALASTAPGSPGAREALIAIVEECDRFFRSPYHLPMSRAMAELAQHHGDDPEAIRLGLGLENTPDEPSDTLLRRFYASAKGHEARGLARLALANYLVRKQQFAKGARTSPERSVYRNMGPPGTDGQPTDVPVPQDDAGYAYKLHLAQCDPEAIGSEALRLYQEVIADYGEVRALSRRDRQFQKALEQSPPSLRGQKLEAEGIARIRSRLERVPTLAQAAQAALDDWLKLVVGQPAPQIEGVDVQGKPLRLADFRGRVVLLVFWGSWCGPCMAQVPEEKALLERFQGRPFSVVGVNCNEDAEAARAAMEREGMTWPSWHDGEDDGGPIAEEYHVDSFPSAFLIDARGILRARDARGPGLIPLIETSLHAAESDDSPEPPTSTEPAANP
jgi:thiol-disulfide isomerase/thioredoxin